MKNPTIQGLVALLAMAPVAVLADTTVFSDDFSNGSTYNGSSVPGGTPTASSTSYDVASSKNATASMSSGNFRMGMAATSSGFVEAQAVFSSSPQSLSTVGDSLRLTFTFTDVNNILAGGSGSYLCYGLYNTAGSAPLTGLTSSGLTATAGSPNATGGVQLWQGYVGRLAGTAGNSLIYTRPQQSKDTSENQDLIGNNWGGGAFDTPQGATLGSVASTLALTTDAQYTVDFILSLTAANTYSIDSILYEGVGTAGTVLSTQNATASDANFLTDGFDGLAIGYRQASASPGLATTLGINDIMVSVNVVPEPSAGMLGLAGLALFGMIKRLRRQ